MKAIRLKEYVRPGGDVVKSVSFSRCHRSRRQSHRRETPYVREYIVVPEDTNQLQILFFRARLFSYSWI